MKLIIDEEHAGIRIDNAVAQMSRELSRSQVKKLIRLGKISVNDKPTKSAYITEHADEITIEENIASETILKPINKPLDIIFEDENICVLNKPQGLTVHPSEASDDETLVNYLLHHFPNIKDVGDDPLRPGIVHRLDKLTSGVMVVAKNQKAFESLKQAWKDGLIQKEYYGVVWGDIEKAGSLSGKISRSKRTGRMVTRNNEGRDAVTLFNPLEHYTTSTLVQIATHTGRTHQIRTHFKSMGSPVMGDPLYQYKKKKNKFPRLYLHALTLTFPYKGEKLTFTAELPEDFTSFINSLKKK